MARGAMRSKKGRPAKRRVGTLSEKKNGRAAKERVGTLNKKETDPELKGGWIEPPAAKMIFFGVLG